MQYNGGTVFSQLVPGFTVGPLGSSASSQNSGLQTITGSVSSIQSFFDFTLSANDEASGTSNFAVTPEPSSLVLLLGAAVMGLLGARRGMRRRA